MGGEVAELKADVKIIARHSPEQVGHAVKLVSWLCAALAAVYFVGVLTGCWLRSCKRRRYRAQRHKEVVVLPSGLQVTIHGQPRPNTGGVGNADDSRKSDHVGRTRRRLGESPKRVTKPAPVDRSGAYNAG